MVNYAEFSILRLEILISGLILKTFTHVSKAIQPNDISEKN